MSRIGREPITVPAGVEVSVSEHNHITVKGPKGTLERDLVPQMKIDVDAGVIHVSRPDDTKENRSLHGLTRALVDNMVVGVTHGFEKKLEINGVGYRAAKEGKNLVLNIGYSHQVIVPETEDIQIDVPDANHVVIKGIDKQKVGQFAAEVRGKRPPEPYKGKGIKYDYEVIRRKEGKAGLFEMAHNGTIFLDEINSMAPSIQSKLLRVLETKQVMRLGSDYVIPLDIRIISASNADIIAAVQAGSFRRDLFFRINPLRLSLPPLNERPDDILYLFAYFLENFTHRRQPLKASLKKALIQHDWWGNIRELHSVALRYYIFGDTLDDDYDTLFDIPDGAQKNALLDTASLQLNMKSLEKTIQQILIEELQEKGYSQKDIAKLLNVSRQTIFNKMRP